eukprot:COSAG01_NODE_30251_length_619_cov_4.159615_1_plen_67_part_10
MSPRAQKKRSHARSSTAPSTGDDDGPKPPPFLARLCKLATTPKPLSSLIAIPATKMTFGRAARPQTN